jgi:hypothetical protein
MFIIYPTYYLQSTLLNYLNNTKPLLHVDQHNKMFIAYIIHPNITYYLSYLLTITYNLLLYLLS